MCSVPCYCKALGNIFFCRKNCTDVYAHIMEQPHKSGKKTTKKTTIAD